MQAQGTDKRGQGGAKATIFSRLAPVDGRGTRVEVVTDYHITGRLARFGRGGMIEDISERLLREFAKRLQTSLAAQQETMVSPAPAAAPEPAAPAAQPAAPSDEAPPAAPEPEAAPMAAGEPEAPVSPAAEPEAPAAPFGEPARYETTFAQSPVESTPPEAPVSPAGGWAPPPPPPAEPPAEDITPRRRRCAEPVARSVDAGPDGCRARCASPVERGLWVPVRPMRVHPVRARWIGAGHLGGAAGAASAAQPRTAPGDDAAGGAARRHRTPVRRVRRSSTRPQPSEPMQGLSLVGGVLWSRVKRNPAPAAAAGVAVMLLLARRRRRRH